MDLRSLPERNPVAGALAAALVLTAALSCAAPEQAATESGDGGPGTTLAVTSFGGAWQKAQAEAMFEPFSQETGIAIEQHEYAGEYSLIAEKGAAGEWDVVDVEPAELLHGARDGLFEPIDYAGIDQDALLESAVHPYGVGLMTYAVVLGYSTAAFPDAEAAPSTWADFWDLDRFPGKRALRNNPQWMLEIALLADGVAPDELYPLDLDRAFASLDRIRDSVVVFDDWARPGEMLTSGEVTMAVGTNGRLLSSREAGEPVQISWDGALVSSDYFVIPAGSQHKEAAQKLIDFAVSRQAQARFPLLIDYGPVNRKALADLPQDVRQRLPLAEGLLRLDAAWWLDHEEEANRRYAEWLPAAD
jgi:putative spermidine/putrescine transport system substrate-binding protein